MLSTWDNTIEGPFQCLRSSRRLRGPERLPHGYSPGITFHSTGTFDGRQWVGRLPVS